MKIFFLFLLAVGYCFSAYSQVNPNVLKNQNILKNQPVIKNQVIINPVINLSSLTDFYMESNGFLGVNTSSDKVVSNQCAGAAINFHWRAVNNSDGTVTIFSLLPSGPKMMYRKSTIVLPGNTGLSGAASTQDGLYAVPVAAGNPGRYKINDKWWLRSLGGEEYRLVFEDRSDSIPIHIYPSSEVNPVDLDFNSMVGWTLTEGNASNNAFTGQPSTILYIPFFDSPVIPNMPLGGSYWKGLENKYFAVDTKTDGKYINTSRPGTNQWIRPDETKTGVLTTLPFVLCGEKMTVKLAGTNDPSRIKFELLQKLKVSEPGAVSLPDGYYKIISSNTGHNNDITQKIVINTHDQKYKVCRLRITDNSTAGHIIVDEINVTYTGQVGSDPVPLDPVIPTSKPIWGTIDMHTHPMSYLGMGGKLMHGKLDGNPAEALGNCNCTHGGWGTDNTCGNYLRAEIVNMIDEYYTDAVRLKAEDIKVPHKDHPHDGYPNFVHWPVQMSMTHQQMWYEWMRRAKDGGLTAIIALTVNSEVLGRVLGGDAPYDDKTTADRQIDELIAFVHRHRDFLDTVTTSARMRQVVREGKMAVIIGMEVDNIGNFYKNVPVTNDQIRNEITRLKNKGVRYIFPIHVTDNKFGGTAVYKELFNFSNKYVTGQPITGTVPVDLYPPVLPGNLYSVETAPDRNVGYRLEGGVLNIVTKTRPLVEIIEAGGFPVLPPPLDVPTLAVKPIVDPVIVALKNSQQFQLAKKIFLDLNPEFASYDRIVRSPTDKGGHRNVLGISDQGIFAVTEMMRQGLMIDVDHASEKTVNDIIAIAQRNHYPVNSGHNGLRQPGDNEKTRTREQLEAIRDLGGMFGMGWENQNPVQFNNNYRTHVGIMGNRSATFGSDIDGYAATPKAPASPRQFINYTDRSQPDFLQQYVMPGSSRVWDYNTGGMAHIGMVPDFFEALKKAGAGTDQLNALFLSAEYFAQMWEKCERTAPAVR